MLGFYVNNITKASELYLKLSGCNFPELDLRQTFEKREKQGSYHDNWPWLLFVFWPNSKASLWRGDCNKLCWEAGMNTFGHFNDTD